MARVKIDGDSSGLVAAQRKAKEEAKLVEAAFADIRHESTKLERQVKKTWSDSRPALEKYNERMRQLGILFKQNKINQNQLTHATEKAKEQFLQTGNASRRAFGTTAMSQMKSYIASIGGITAAIGLARQAFRDLEQDRSDMAAKLDESREPRGRIFQLPQDPRQIQAMADTIQRRGVDQTKSNQLAFQLASANMTQAGDLSMFARIEASKFADAESLITAVSKFRANFPQSGTRDVLSGSLAAASEIAGVGTSEVLSAAITAAKASQAVNLSNVDLLAATTVLTQQEKSPERAATQLRSLAAGIRESQGTAFDVVGENLNATLDNIQRRLDAGAQPKDIIGGRIEAQSALDTLLGSRAALTATGGKIQAGIDQGIVAERLGQAEADPVIRREIELAKRRERRLIAGREEALDKAGREEMKRAVDDPSENIFPRLGRRTAAKHVADFGGSEAAIEAAGTAGAIVTGANMSQTARLLPAADPAIINALMQIRDNTRGKPGVARPEN